MFEVLKVAAAKAAELWSGVPGTTEDGRAKSVELPNGVVIKDSQLIHAAQSLERAPTGAVDDWYKSTLPGAFRYRKVPLNLLDELLVNSKLFLATCELNEKGAGYGLRSTADSYACDYIRSNFKDVRETAERRFVLHKPHAGRNSVEPIKSRRSGCWIVPAGDERVELRRCALENLKDIATALGKRHDSNDQHQRNVTQLWWLLGCIDAGEEVHN